MGTTFRTNLFCPCCGNDTEAEMLHDGYIVASPTEPTLRCEICRTEFRIGLYPTNEDEVDAR